MRKYRVFKYLLMEICAMLCISYILSCDLFGVSNDIKDMYLYYFSYEFIGQNISVFQISISLIPISIMISMFADSLSYELYKNAAYIFTRSKNRTKWLINKLTQILIEITLADILLFIVAFIFFYFLGYKIVNFKEFISITLEIFILLLLTQYLLIIIANLISIKLDPTYGYIISNLIYIISILNFYYLSLKKITLLKYIPFTQQLISVQDNDYINRSISYFSKYIVGYGIRDAIIFDLIILIIVILVGIRQIKKAEFY